MMMFDEREAGQGEDVPHLHPSLVSTNAEACFQFCVNYTYISCARDLLLYKVGIFLAAITDVCLFVSSSVVSSAKSFKSCLY